jgi:hypothetical protein
LVLWGCSPYPSSAWEIRNEWVACLRMCMCSDCENACDRKLCDKYEGMTLQQALGKATTE